MDGSGRVHYIGRWLVAVVASEWQLLRAGVLLERLRHFSGVAAAENFVSGEQANISTLLGSDPNLGDPNLAAALAANPVNGAVGFQQMPVGFDYASLLATISDPNQVPSLHDIGTVFNAVENHELGGSPTYLPQVVTDLNAIETGLQHLLGNPADLAQIEVNENAAGAAATTAALQTVANDIALMQQQITTTSPGPTLSSPVGARGGRNGAGTYLR
jgi:hypothetical protein